ncbi:MAG: DUF4149 domain-containing protein [Burkholderiaceae bacterium]|nr:DUF4149 domain-containing protein [Burkholderiaceae bacterium]
MPENARERLANRVFGVVGALWLGGVATLALVAAPTLFALLDRPTAGRLAGQMFRIEAHAALAFALLLFVIERVRLRRVARESGRARVSADLLLVAGALFCTVLGYFGLQPMMEAAKAGEPVRLGFGALHGLSTFFFAVKGLLLLALVWRRSGR